MLSWKTIDEEPELGQSYILFSAKEFKFYNGSYIKKNYFEVNGLYVNRKNFDFYIGRSEFFEESGLDKLIFGNLHE